MVRRMATGGFEVVQEDTKMYGAQRSASIARVPIRATSNLGSAVQVPQRSSMYDVPAVVVILRAAMPINCCGFGLSFSVLRNR